MARIAMHTLGTRGDVQPFVALGQGLVEAGHEVCLATAPQFESFVTGHGLAFEPLQGDLVDLISTPIGRQAVSGRNWFLARLALMRRLKPMFSDLLDAQWKAARGIDAIIFHPKAFGGAHIAEKLNIPAFMALPVPGLSATRDFPLTLQPFTDLGPFNRASYWPLIRFGDLGFRKTVAKWRTEALDLPARHHWLSLKGMPVPKLYGCSPHIVSPPADWDGSAHITGTWFLKRDPDWRPPEALTDFLKQGPPPVYVGFGSLLSEDSGAMTDLVVAALQMAGQRAILASGWGGLTPKDLPSTILSIDQAPHEWLFGQVSCVVHHGGAGTTAAGLRAGRPSVICPFFGDQPFWGHRVHQLGAGPKPIPQRKLTAERLAIAIKQALDDPAIASRAAAIGKAMRLEDGVGITAKLITAGLERHNV